MKWTKAEKDFVEPSRVARLATVDSNGVPHNVPICPILDKGRFYFGTEVGAKKMRNIQANPNVSLVFDDYTEAWEHLRGIMIQGQARVVTTREFRALRKKIYAKYLQYKSAASLIEGESSIVEVSPSKKFKWGF